MNWDSSCLTTRSSGPVSILNWTMMRFPIIVRLFVSGLQAVGSHRSFAHSIVLCTRSRNYQINTRRYWPWRERARIKERCTSHASHSREKLTKWEMECWVKHDSELYTRKVAVAAATLQDIRCVSELKELYDEPSIEETQKALDSLRSWRAPGMNSIHMRIWNAVKAVLQKNFTNFFVIASVKENWDANIWSHSIVVTTAVCYNSA